MIKGLLDRDAEKFLENREEPITVATVPYEEGETVGIDHPDYGHGNISVDEALEYFNQLKDNEASSDYPSGHNFVDPNGVEAPPNSVVQVDNIEGDLHYSLKFDAQNNEGDKYGVIMHGAEEEYAENRLDEEYQQYVDEGNLALIDLIGTEFEDELMED